MGKWILSVTDKAAFSIFRVASETPTAFMVDEIYARGRYNIVNWTRIRKRRIPKSEAVVANTEMTPELFEAIRKIDEAWLHEDLALYEKYMAERSPIEHEYRQKLSAITKRRDLELALMKDKYISSLRNLLEGEHE